MGRKKQLFERFLILATVFFLAGCATISPELKQAQQLEQTGELRSAIAQYEQALAKASSQKQRTEIAGQIAQLRERVTRSVVQEVNALLAQRKTIPALVEAIALLDREKGYDNASGDLARLLAEQKSSLASAQEEFAAAAQKADEAEKADAWSDASAALRRMAALNPSPAIDKRLADLVKRRDDYVPFFIEKLLEAKSLVPAEKELEKFANENPKPDAKLLAGLRGKVESLRQELLEQQTQALMAEKKFYTAYQLIQDEGRDYLKKFLPAVRAEGAKHYKQKAAEELAAGGTSLGYAYFAAEKAFELMPEDSDIFRIRRDISDIIDLRITQQIAIDAFSSPAEEPEAGVALSNTLMEHLMNNVPYGIQILERRKIEQVLEESGTERRELESKVKMWIVGDVTTLNVERQRSAGLGTAMVEKGKTVRPNTEYIRYVEEYGRDKRKWPAQVQHINPEIEEPVTELVKYNYGDELLSGIMVVSVRTFESAQGAVVGARVFKSNISTNDSFNDEVALAVPKIPRDALQLPTDNDIKEMLRNELATQIGLYVLHAFEQRESQFLQSARNYIERREFPLAVADLAGGHYYAHKDKRYVPDPVTNEAAQALRQLGFFEYTE